jgi:hypothetical protein
MKNTNQTSQLMKKTILLAASLLALTFTPVFSQPAGTRVINNATSQNQPPALTKFNLDFPGGTPAELVKAIEKATGKPLNAIIPTEDADLQMPPLKMNDVLVPQLFTALQVASRKTVAVSSGNNFGSSRSYSMQTTSYGFNTADSLVTDASIWYFHAEKPSLPPVAAVEAAPEKICQFYPLSPYLDRGFTVDDITTAIQTGWKMAGLTRTPELNYHKETKLLIAFGEPDQLKTIDDVLRALPSSNVTVAAAADFAKSWQTSHNQIVELDSKIQKLEREIAKLTSATNSPAEKSGK